MRIGQFVEYRGYTGSIEYDPDDKIYYGILLDIYDLVDYYSDNFTELERVYHEAVDDYIELKKQIGENNANIDKSNMEICAATNIPCSYCQPVCDHRKLYT